MISQLTTSTLNCSPHTPLSLLRPHLLALTGRSLVTVGQRAVQELLKPAYDRFVFFWWDGFASTLDANDMCRLDQHGFTAEIMTILCKKRYYLEPYQVEEHGDPTAEPPSEEHRRQRVARAVGKAPLQHFPAFQALYERLWGTEVREVWPGRLGP